MDDYDSNDFNETFVFEYTSNGKSIVFTEEYEDAGLFDTVSPLHQFLNFLKAVGYGSDVKILVNGEEIK